MSILFTLIGVAFLGCLIVECVVSDNEFNNNGSDDD